MAKGRPPKPTELKILDGTYRKDRDGKRATSSTGQQITEMPAPPKSLGKVGQQHWNTAAEILIGLGVLASSDLPALELYAATWQDKADCEADIAKNGYVQTNPKTGLESDRPAVKRRAAAIERIIRLIGRLGFSPADRRSLPAPFTTQDTPGGVGQRPRSRVLTGRPN